MRSFVEPFLPYVILLAGWGLLVWDLGGKSLWVDELFTAHVATLAPAQIVDAVAADVHPPLYFLALRGWVALAGASEFALRWPSVAAAALGLGLLWKLGDRLGGRAVALAGLAALAFSPLFVEFSRMARYYSWVLALGVLATLLLVTALRRPGWRDWVGYTVAALAILYTFYPGFALVAAHGVGLVLDRRVKGALKWRWLGCVGVAAALALPWLFNVREQALRAGGMIDADYAGSLTGLALSITYPFYAFSVGETVFPWFPLALPAAVAVLALAAWGVTRRLREWGILLAAVVILPVLLTALATVYVASGTPFLNVPARALFVLPYLALGLGAGLIALGRSFRNEEHGTRNKRVLPRSRLFLVPGSLSLVGIVWAVALYNGYTGQQFLNPNYVIPAREVAQGIAAQAGPADAVIGEWDSGFSYYYRRTGSAAPYFEALEPEPALDYLASHRPQRVWLATIGRDRTREVTPVALIGRLEADYRLVAEEGYAEQDATYRRMKEVLLRRPAYRYKLVVRRYELNASHNAS